jgi:hypothetical protein
MEPRKPGDVRRIIGRAGYASAEADLKEFDQLLSEESFHDPSVKLSAAQKRESSARKRRLEFLNRRLLKNAR